MSTVAERMGEAFKRATDEIGLVARKGDYYVRVAGSGVIGGHDDVTVRLVEDMFTYAQEYVRPR